VKGILGEKIGMTQIFDDESRVVPVTVVKVAGCRVGQIKTDESDGYDAVQLCLGTQRRDKANKPASGHARRWGIDAPRTIVELRTGPDDTFEAGQAIGPDVFEAGERVDVTGVSKGKGTAGVMKRHNFRGMNASHGAHRVHRHGGSIGMCATPARVFKGMRMAGHMGAERVTMQNLEIVQADTERELLLIKGAIPGPRGAVVMVRQRAKEPAKKKGRG
jgi:large subunit ribosomal protein L3